MSLYEPETCEVIGPSSLSYLITGHTTDMKEATIISSCCKLTIMTYYDQAYWPP